MKKKLRLVLVFILCASSLCSCIDSYDSVSSGSVSEISESVSEVSTDNTIPNARTLKRRIYESVESCADSFVAEFFGGRVPLFLSDMTRKSNILFVADGINPLSLVSGDGDSSSFSLLSEVITDEKNNYSSREHIVGIDGEKTKVLEITDGFDGYFNIESYFNIPLRRSRATDDECTKLFVEALGVFLNSAYSAVSTNEFDIKRTIGVFGGVSEDCISATAVLKGDRLKSLSEQALIFAGGDGHLRDEYRIYTGAAEREGFFERVINPLMQFDFEEGDKADLKLSLSDAGSVTGELTLSGSIELHGRFLCVAREGEYIFELSLEANGSSVLFSADGTRNESGCLDTHTVISLSLNDSKDSFSDILPFDDPIPGESVSFALTADINGSMQGDSVTYDSALKLSANMSGLKIAINMKPKFTFAHAENSETLSFSGSTDLPAGSFKLRFGIETEEIDSYKKLTPPKTTVLGDGSDEKDAFADEISASHPLFYEKYLQSLLYENSLSGDPLVLVSTDEMYEYDFYPFGVGEEYREFRAVSVSGRKMTVDVCGKSRAVFSFAADGSFLTFDGKQYELIGQNDSGQIFFCHKGSEEIGDEYIIFYDSDLEYGYFYMTFYCSVGSDTIRITRPDGTSETIRYEIRGGKYYFDDGRIFDRKAGTEQ